MREDRFEWFKYEVYVVRERQNITLKILRRRRVYGTRSLVCIPDKFLNCLCHVSNYGILPSLTERRDPPRATNCVMRLITLALITPKLFARKHPVCNGPLSRLLLRQLLLFGRGPSLKTYRKRTSRAASGPRPRTMSVSQCLTRAFDLEVRFSSAGRAACQLGRPLEEASTSPTRARRHSPRWHRDCDCAEAECNASGVPAD